jgi:hypothetical protein
LSFPKGLDEALERIKTWLDEEDYRYAQVMGKQTQNTLFNYLVTLPSGITINIFQPSLKKDSICVSTRLAFTPEQIRLFSQKTKTERNEILSEMQFKLASVDVEFSFTGGEIPNTIRIDHPIYYDALTKDRFFKAIGTVYKAFIIAGRAFTQSL